MNKNIKSRIALALKGVAMGAADVVPGVSGGTIAFISGIYEELVETISSVSFGSLRTLFKEGIGAFWKAINGNFLLTLGFGIAVSIIAFAKVIGHQLEANPVAIWAFFFGLVAASIPLVAQRVRLWNSLAYLSFGIGAIAAFLITQLPAVEEPGAGWYLFMSGAIAICAMILPGISGSFILLLLGSYLPVLEAVNERDFVSIGIFAAGAGIGLLSFSHVLKWMFERFHDLTVALLSGFLLGSLNKIWPWKHVLQSITKHAGTAEEEVVVIADENVWPWDYTAGPQQLGMAIVLMLVGVAVIVLLHKIAAKKA